MATKKAARENDTSTEEKIKNAAYAVFHRKGFAATRTRDIAEEAGINLALLNYYFRSKQKLFEIVMLDTMHGFFRASAEVFNNRDTSLENKIETLADRYIDLLTAHPDMPFFLFGELKTNPGMLVSKMGIKQLVMDSHFMEQFRRGIREGKIAPVHPLHFIVNIMGMIVFPFIAAPILKGLGDLSQKELDELIRQRKQLIPKWIGATMKTT